MVILKQKKGKMQAVKLILSLVALSLSHWVQAQSISLEGNYTWVGAAGLSSISMNLKNNYFTYKSQSDFGGIFLSKGYYLIKRDTLILMHEKYSDLNSSSFKVTKQVDSIASSFGLKQQIKKDMISMTLIILDSNNMPIQGAQIALTANNKTLSLFFTDLDGKAVIYTEGRIADKLIIGFIGKANLEINLDNFWGHSTDISVVLTKDNYNKSEFIEKYVLFSGNDGKLRLKSLTSNDIFQEH